MKLEDQVCSLELAKRLKKLGVKQESYFWWSNKTSDDKWKVENRDFYAIDMRCDVSAFTVADLGEMLPKFITNHDFSPNPNTAVGYYSLFYCPENNADTHMHEVRYQYSPEAIEWRPDALPLPKTYSLYVSDKTEADARAKMLIYLIENKLIETDQEEIERGHDEEAQKEQDDEKANKSKNNEND